ncbi:uncharacterized protein GLRG_01031 [Colletotrichum graminicola M1.001]|uniref:Uncharacterized protein n=1 Tax=Colletotrichum graminicola (strain M1.001 / M2 / FGSC 10212) TaxID=645133 RepID=E3Q5C0_COLGM|nr:uncharacterized protein GLRG_01031 [Colletotrichum graminicola M1.001]EFQ25887.1 hypothetical protein GLRG_01031 [Colletotrichum graminicola M1.001]
MRLFVSEMITMMAMILAMITIGVDRRTPDHRHLGLITMTMGLESGRKGQTPRRLGQMAVTVVQGDDRAPVPRPLAQIMVIGPDSGGKTGQLVQIMATMDPDHDQMIPTPLSHLVGETTVCTVKQTPPKGPGGSPGRPDSGPGPDQPDNGPKPLRAVDRE